MPVLKSNINSVQNSCMFARSHSLDKCLFLQAFAEPSQQADTGAGNADVSGPVSTSKENYDHTSVQSPPEQPVKVDSQMAADQMLPEHESTELVEAQQSGSPAIIPGDTRYKAPVVVSEDSQHGDLVAEQLQSNLAGTQDGKLMSLLMD